jgi:hypothetical protein
MSNLEVQVLFLIIALRVVSDELLRDLVVERRV